MDYSNYQLQDFVTDERFQGWVLHPSAEEDLFWNDWLAAHPWQRDTVAKARLLVAALQLREPAVPFPEQQAGWERLSAAVASPKAVTRRYSTSFVFRVAAVITLLLTALGTGWWLTQHFGKTTYQTTYGQILTVILPDSSEVVLNANSRLEVSRRWDPGRDREVWLNGEAYFRVRKKPAKTRFRVYTDRLNVEVLGTSFNVVNRTHRQQVVLKEGSVRVQVSAQEDIMMQPGELVEIATSAGASKRRVDPDQYKAWLDKKMVFKATPLREVAQTIEDLYGYRVEFKEPALAGKQLTAILPVDNLEVLLTGLSATFGLDIRKSNQKLIIQTAPNTP